MRTVRFQETMWQKGWALLPLRLMVGFGFVAHGYAKLNRGPEAFATILRSIGVPHPLLIAWATSLLEFLGGTCVMAGAFIIPLSLPLVSIMLTAMVSVHLRYGFSSVRLLGITAEGAKFGPIGYELNLLYIAGLFALALGGPGALSLNRYLHVKGRTNVRRNLSLQIRPAVSEDAEGIARTFLESAQYHARLDPDRYLLPAVDTISARYREGRQHLSNPAGQSITFVADLSGEIVGFIDARVEQSPDEMHRKTFYCHVTEIAVRTEQQNQGIGSQLLRAAEEWGRGNGAEFACLEYHVANARAGGFYRRRMGYGIASITAIKCL